MSTLHALIVSHEPLLRRGLKSFLIKEAGLHACVTAASAAEALAAVDCQPPDLLVLAGCALNGDAPRIIRDLRRCVRDFRMLVVGPLADADYVRRVFQAGARGYVTVLDDDEELKLAVASVLKGGIHVTRLAADGLLVQLMPRDEPAESECARLDALSDRELEVFQCVGRHLSCKEIAAELGISVKTVETHKMRIKEKLHLQHGAELTRVAANRAARQTRRQP